MSEFSVQITIFVAVIGYVLYRTYADSGDE